VIKKYEFKLEVEQTLFQEERAKLLGKVAELEAEVSVLQEKLSKKLLLTRRVS
jgi:hypothetical protein